MSETLELAIALIGRESVTPEDCGCQTLIANRMARVGFNAEYLNFFDTQNIWLRRGKHQPLLVFLGHTDVVPPGPLSAWQSPPFSPTLRDGKLFGRGAADMKGSIAAFITATERFVGEFPNHRGSIAILLTSDEEGPALHGVVKVVDVLARRGDKIDWCLVGEPSSDHVLGDVVRVGRRGSLCAKLTVKGQQGHVAYPNLAHNPIHAFAPALLALTRELWDQGNSDFPPTRLQVSNIRAGTGAENIIPGDLEAQFNLRFSPNLDVETIKSRTVRLLDNEGLDYALEWRLSGQPFLTKPGELTSATHAAIRTVTGLKARNDTGGGTSDGRFIAPTGAQVIELGLLNATIHQVNEHVDTKDLETLSEIYQHILINLLA